MKVRKRDIPFLFVAYLELLVCFLYSYMNASLRGGLAIIGCVFLVLMYLFMTKSSIKKEEIGILVGIAVCLFFVIWRNFDLQDGYYGRFFYLLLSFLFMSMMIGSFNWCKRTIKHLRWISLCITLIILFQLFREMINRGDMNLFIHCEVLLSISVAGLLVKNAHKTGYWLCIILSIITIVLTGKSGPPLFHVCTVITVIYIGSFQKTKKRTIALLIMYIIVAIVTISSEIIAPNGISSLIGELYTDEVTNGRVTLFTRAIDLFLESPWLGKGWGGYRKYSLIYGYEVHNIYLQLLCEVGIIGTVAFLSVFIASLRRTLKSLSRCDIDKDVLRVLYVSLYGQIYFLLYGLSGNPLYDFNFLLYGYYVAMAYSASVYITECEENIYEEDG